MRLLAACADWLPPSGAAAARLSQVRAAAAEIGDWPDFAAHVRRHRVAGLVSDAFAQAKLDVPVCAAGPIRRMTKRAARQALAATTELGRLAELCRESGPAFAVIKGVPLSGRVYGNIGLRHAKDIDLLVAPDQVDAMADALERLGYRPSELRPTDGQGLRTLWYRARKDLPFRNPQTGVEIELHWRLLNNEQLLNLPFDAGRLVEVALGPRISAPVLRLDDEFAYLCAHGAGHGWVRLKWLADIHAILAQRSAEGIEDLYRHAARLGAGRAAAQAIVLSAWVFRTPVPPTFLDRLEAQSSVRLLSEIAFRAVTRAGGREHDDVPFATLTTGLSRLLLGGGLRYWRREVALTLMNPEEFMAFGLPDRMAGIYPLLRPALWVASQLGAGRKPARTVPRGPVKTGRRG
jgi:hypothetical protein